MPVSRLSACLIAGLCTLAAGGVAYAADTPAPGSPASAPQAGNAAPSGGNAAASGGNPASTATSTPKGQLKSPYSDVSKIANEGHQLYMSAGCNGCHGGEGGGGMGPPLTNEVWIYGNDDDTLFRLIALGSDGLQKQGYQRKGSENVVGPMPQFGTIIKSDDDLWKIIGWIHSLKPASSSGTETR